MDETEPFVDIHCHLLPDIDDGSKSWDESLSMAEMAVAEGTAVVVCTPHQLGSYAHIGAREIRERTCELQLLLDERGIPLQVLPGADVRVDTDLVPQIRRSEVLSLADHRKHVLLDLPHETFFALDDLLDALAEHGITGILSHPERNQGLLRQPGEIESLLSHGCLMQVTADSILGTLGSHCQHLAEQMLANGDVHFVATDAHSPRFRRPLLRRAFERVCELAGGDVATEIFCHNPRRVAEGKDVMVRPRRSRSGIFFSSWFGRRRAG
jgi:protein-tyrosine phosphatase